MKSVEFIKSCANAEIIQNTAKSVPTARRFTKDACIKHDSAQKLVSLIQGPGRRTRSSSSFIKMNMADAGGRYINIMYD